MKVWTREELERAETGVRQRYYGASVPDDMPAELKPIRKITDVAIDLQCELNDARELLEHCALHGDLGGATFNAVQDWLSRNSLVTKEGGAQQ